MMDKFKLDESGNPVLCADLLDWANSFEGQDRRVAWDEIGDVQVSTVFLGIDHVWNGKPLLFETMIFGGEHDQYQERYSTRDEAVAGHTAAVKMVKGEV